MFDSLQIQYQTGPFIAAPHAYEVEIRCNPKKDGLEVAFNQTYIHRDDLDKQEIEAEGFTENDDFAWNGILPEIWTGILDEKISETSFLPELSEQIFLKVENGKSQEKGVPNAENEWIGLVELLIQACLEAGGKELPMELVLGKLEKNNFYEKGRLVWRFENRALQGQVLSGNSKRFCDKDWVESQSGLKSWIEAEAQQADLYQIPDYKGLFWLLNGEVWLAYGSAPDIPAIEWIETELGM